MSMFCFDSSCSDMLMVYRSVLQLDIPTFYLYFVIMLFQIILAHVVIAFACKL